MRLSPSEKRPRKLRLPILHVNIGRASIRPDPHQHEVGDAIYCASHRAPICRFDTFPGPQSAVGGADVDAVCHVTWTGLKQPPEIPFHSCAITSKIPIQQWSMG